MTRMGGLEAPDNSSGSAVIVLICAGVVAVHVVALKAPRKTLEAEFVVHATADINKEGIVDEPAGVQVADASHCLHERTPSADIGGVANATYTIVLFHALAGEGTDINHETQVRDARKGKVLKGNVQAFIALLVDNVGELAVGDSAVYVSTGKKAIELCRHRNGEQEQACEGQHGGSGFRHEISLPGLRAGKQAL